MSKPPLPLHIDSTMLTCFRGCPQKFRKEFVLGFRPPGISIDLHAGGCFATAIEHVRRGVFERNLSMSGALEYGHAAFSLAWGTFQIPEYKNTAKTFDRTWAAVEEYFARWEPRTDHIQPFLAADGKPTLEYTFAIPLEGDGWPTHSSGGPFLYCGRFDMLGSVEGRPVPLDEKTTGGSIGQSWPDKWELRNQFMGYLWACRTAGIDVRSVIVRGIAILKTKIDLAEAEKFYSEELIARWLEQLRRDLWRIRQAYDADYFDYDFADNCTAYGNCIFLNACASPVSQEASWLSNFEVRRWDPLHKNPIKPSEAA